MASNLRIVPLKDTLRVGEVRILKATDATTGNEVPAFWWINPNLTGIGDEDDDHLIPHPSSALTFVNDQGHEFADISDAPVSSVKIKGKSLEYIDDGDFGTVEAARELWSNTPEWHDKTDLISFLTFALDLKVTFQIADVELPMSETTDGGTKIYRVLPGVRVRINTGYDSLALTSTKCYWSATSGAFYRSNLPSAPLLPAEQANGFDLTELYWEFNSSITEATVKFQVKIIDEVVVELPITFRTRAVAQAMTGDDVLMLQRVLWCLGQSQGTTPGVQGTPVSMDGSFGSATQVALKRLQSIDEVAETGVLDATTFGRLLEHLVDYQRAYETYASFPFINRTHPAFPTWVAAAGAVMAQTLTDAILNSIQAGLTREALITAWVKKESIFGHWGFNSRNFRTTVGSADEQGSFGFNQILNKYRYGGQSRSADLVTLNFYDPADGVRALAVFCNSLTAGLATGGGFSKAFVGPTPTYRATHAFPAGIFPRLGASLHFLTSV